MNVTNEQLDAARSGDPVELTAHGEVFVLLTKDVFERVKPALAYDDSDWTEEEMSQLAAQTFEDADNAGPIL
jgi:prevent-host-death family protein